MIVLRLIVFGLSLLMIATGAGAAERVALVIGNSDYDHVSRLPNPRNDSADIAHSLRRLGFEVAELGDLGFAAMRRALGEFRKQALNAEMAVVFYAGHGMEVSNRNYLIPTDAELATDAAISYEAIPLDLVTEAVSGASTLKLVMLDACRNNPFAAGMELTSPDRAIGRGLARVEPVAGTLVAFAAREGTVASDGDGRNSPFTAALLKHLEEPGLEIQFLFRRVRDSVMLETRNRQQPFTYGSLPGREIFLKNGAKAGDEGKSVAEETAELRRQLEELRVQLEGERRKVGTKPDPAPEGNKLAALEPPASEKTETPAANSTSNSARLFRFGPFETRTAENGTGLIVSKIVGQAPGSKINAIRDGRMANRTVYIEPGDRIVSIELFRQLTTDKLPDILASLDDAGQEKADITVIRKNGNYGASAIMVSVPLANSGPIATASAGSGN